MRAGIGTVALPRRNEKDLHDVPAEARERLTFVFLETVDDAIRNAFSANAESALAEPVLAD